MRSDPRFPYGECLCAGLVSLSCSSLSGRDYFSAGGHSVLDRKTMLAEGGQPSRHLSWLRWGPGAIRSRGLRSASPMTPRTPHGWSSASPAGELTHRKFRAAQVLPCASAADSGGSSSNQPPSSHRRFAIPGRVHLCPSLFEPSSAWAADSTWVGPTPQPTNRQPIKLSLTPAW